MARSDAENVIARLRQMGEEGLSSIFNEAMTNERMRKSLGRAGERFMQNKHNFDRNVETLLDFVNLPSKRDVRELKARLDHLSSQLLNLSIKLDRVLGQTPRALPGKSGSRKPSKGSTNSPQS